MKCDVGRTFRDSGGKGVEPRVLGGEVAPTGATRCLAWVAVAAAVVGRRVAELAE